MKLIDPEVLKNYIDNKYISVQKHPTEDLYIYNYTQKCQFERVWDEVTMACRGLIMDGTGKIIARPFEKFFNLDEYTSMGNELPTDDFEVYDKLDGSLGILYHLSDGTPQIATRGSFVSDQAKKGTEMLLKAISKQPGFTVFNLEKTWLFEIIYPQNRIVVDYGKTEDLFLLAVIETETGEEYPISLVTNLFPKVKRYDGITDLEKIKELTKDNAEGVVVKWKSGLRVKVKWDEYVRLHRLVTGVNAKRIWEHLKDDQSLNELLERVPEEFERWVNQTVKDLKQQYADIEFTAKNQYRDNFESRRDAAFYFKTCSYPAIMFKLYDKKDYSDLIWKQIKPAAERPFKEDIDA